MDDLNKSYEMLGVVFGASEDDIKHAYRDLVQVWHPDRFAHNPSLQEKAQEKLKEINVAYDKIKSHTSASNNNHESSKPSSSSSTTNNEQNARGPQKEPKREEVSILKDMTARSILNSWSITNSGALKYLGAFADDLVIKNKVAFAVEMQHVIIERSTGDGQNAGEEYRITNDETKLFGYDYDTPDGPIDNKTSTSAVLLSTVQTHVCEPTRQCPSCAGSGRCHKCNRVGHITCKKCDGKGQAQTKTKYLKNGKTRKINETCHSCGGNGWHNCPVCGGNRTCRQCSGNGNVVCARCEGTSKYQTFTVCTSNFKENIVGEVYTDTREIKDHLIKRKGELIYDEIVLDWKNDKVLSTNNVAVMSKFDKEKNSSIVDLIERENKKLIISTQRTARVHLKLYAIPVAEVAYKFEETPYKIFILGIDKYVYANKVPNHHFMPSPTWIDGFANKFNSVNVSLAFTYLTAYLLKSGNNLSEENKEFIKLLVGYCSFNEKGKSALLNKLIGNVIELADVNNKIRLIKNDINAQIFGWYVISFDGKISDQRISTYNNIFNDSKPWVFRSKPTHRSGVIRPLIPF